MATNIVLKRSSTSGAVPGTSDLELGEIALNTYDGKMYMKKTVSGSSSIVELTGGVALSSSAFDLINYKFVATSNQTSFSGSDANSVTLAYASGTIQVFLNGILLDPTDYTATNGTHVVLDTGANSGDILYISRFAGVNPFDDFKYVASSNQTTFSGDDADGNSLLYTVGNLAVYLNGVLLDPTDFTATSGTSVVLASAASSGDILHIHEFNQTGLTEIHSDTTPTLGGDLDMHTFDLVTTDNRNIDIIPHGTGDVNLSTDTVKIGASGEDVIVTTNGTGDITLSTNAGTNSGLVKILDGANQNIEITPNGSGKINLDGLLWPNADGSANQFIQTDGSGNLSFVDVLDTSEEIQDTVGAMFSNNTETGITATYQDSDGTIDLALVSRTIHGVAFDGSANIDLTEEIQDTVGAMFSSNTETNITVTYQDSDGTIDLVVPNTLSNVTELGTLTHLDVDNLNLNGNTLTSTTSDFIIDASHNISLDADGGYINLKDGGTSFGELRNSSTDFLIKSTVADKDILLKGNDGGSEITALRLDMSNAGDATFNSNILINDGKKFKAGNSQDLEIYHSGSHSHIHDNGSGNLYLDTNGAAIELTYNANNENMAQFVANGAVKLYYDNVLKLETASDGITLTSTDAGSSAGPVINLVRDSSSPADADYIGQIKFKGEDDGGASTTYSKITGKIGDASNGSEDGIIEFAAQKAGSSTILARLSSTKLALLNSTYLEGDVTGNVTGNVSGTAATVTTAAQPNITSLGTLTTLTVDDITINGSTISDGGDLTLDAGGDITLDAGGADIYLKDDGTTFGQFFQSSSSFYIKSSVSDADMIFQGNDGGSGITALTLDMSAAGAATFNAGVTATTGTYSGLVTMGGIEVDQYVTHAGDTNTYMEFGTDTLDLRAGGTKGLTVLPGEVAVNQDQADIDFRVESDTDAQAFRVQASTGIVSVGKVARGILTTDNDGSFDIAASNNFKCTPSGNFTLTFTNIAIQTGNILLINSGGHTVSAHANTKVDANILGTISTAGTYLLAYFSDGTNVYMTNSAVYT